MKKLLIGLIFSTLSFCTSASTLTVYLYDSNGVYTVPYAAQADPMQPGKYITPIASTPIALPTTGINQTAQFVNGAWSVIPDYRGATWYDQTLCTSTKITSAGQPTSNLATTESSSCIAAENAPQPNPTGFIQSVKTSIGGIVAANQLSTFYPLFFAAVQQQDWSDVYALIVDANTKGTINSAQYAAIKTAVTANFIPIVLP